MGTNEHYRMLNDRYDVRAQLLGELGFTWVQLSDYETACFIRPRPARKVPVTIAASFVVHADEICWQDRLADVQR